VNPHRQLSATLWFRHASIFYLDRRMLLSVTTGLVYSMAYKTFVPETRLEGSERRRQSWLEADMDNPAM